MRGFQFRSLLPTSLVTVVTANLLLHTMRVSSRPRTACYLDVSWGTAPHASDYTQSGPLWKDLDAENGWVMAVFE